MDQNNFHNDTMQGAIPPISDKPELEPKDERLINQAKEIGSLRTEAAAFYRDNDHLRGRNQRLENKIDQKDKRISELESQVDDLYDQRDEARDLLEKANASLIKKGKKKK